MPSLDISPRPTKRAKISKVNGSESISSRAFQAVTEIVPGRFGLGSTPEDNASVNLGQNGEPAASLSSNMESHDCLDELAVSNGKDTRAVDLGDAPSRRNVTTRSAASKVAKMIQNRREEDVLTNIPLRRETRSNGGAGKSGLQQTDKTRVINEDSSKGVFANQDTKTGGNFHEMNAYEKIPKLRSKERDVQSEDELVEGTAADKSRTRLNRPRKYSLGLERASNPTSTPTKALRSKTPTSTPEQKRGRPRKEPLQNASTPLAETSSLEFKAIKTAVPIANSADGGVHLPEASLGTCMKASTSNNLGLFLKGRKHREPARNLGLLREDVENIPSKWSKGSPVQALQPGKASTDWAAKLSKEPKPAAGLQGERKKVFESLQEALEGNKYETRGLKSHLLERLTGRKCLPLVGMDDEYQRAHQLIEQTVLAGEGNSMLIIGPRGCGKTTLVETIVSDVAKDHHDNFLVVRLNGFIHTDDKLALREIWRQLGREIDEDSEAGNNRSNYSDTLASLLALLSYTPEAPADEMIERAKSVIFIIDEFHLFASHPRQTLLYNLFDVAQSRNAPIAVLGLTSKLDVVESLEKRVKSRFGQRYIYLSYPKNFKAFEDICRSALTVSSQKTGLTPLRLAKVVDNRGIHTAWNRYVDSLFAGDDDLQYFLRRIYTVTKSVPSFLSSVLVPISRLSPTNLPTGSSFVSNALLPPDSNLHLLPALSELELSLVIAAARLDIILDTDVCNFNMVYEEYLQLASKVRMQSDAAGQAVAAGGARVWSREMAKASWERLVELELILPVGSGGRGLENGGMWRVDVALEEIGPSVPGMGSAMARWCKDI
ncbi:MAG: hypothetical protein LQ342_003036 [Letrouitia transgressa]|nr:MAG: hypothetical protein LQ342_003036 [Letrouitia transgressa]